MQFTSALEKHGNKVVDGDVYNNPPVAGRARLIDRTSKHTDVQGGSFDSLTTLVERRLQTPCSFHRFTPEPGDDPVVVLFVDGLTDELKKQVVRVINSLRPPAELV